VRNSLPPLRFVALFVVWVVVAVATYYVTDPDRVEISQ
jgi:hypothetical protein